MPFIDEDLRPVSELELVVSRNFFSRKRRNVSHHFSNLGELKKDEKKVRHRIADGNGEKRANRKILDVDLFVLLHSGQQTV
jgi:hypothetical protein